MVLRWVHVRSRIRWLREELRKLEQQETELRDSVLRLTVSQAPGLTRRQTEVLEQVLLRQSNKEIGNTLHIAERTVKYHVSDLLRIFKVQSRLDLVRTMLPEGD